MKQVLTALALVIALPVTLWAQERGPVTNLLLPRYVSLKSDEVNVRRGPSLSHRIDWVYKRRNMPVEVYGEYENWRRIRDIDGAGGWVHYTLISGVRNVIIINDMQALYSKPDPNSLIEARLELNVVARLEECSIDWCRLRTGGFKGWAPKTSLWGVYAAEIKD